MFWNSKKKDEKERIKRELADANRVSLIRERLSDHVSSGDKTQFDITHSDKTGVNEQGEYEFTVTNIARVNYDVTEWADLTECDTDVRTAFEEHNTKPQEDTDYWSTR